MSVIVIGVDPGDSTGVAILKDTKLWHVLQSTPGDALTFVELTVARFYTDDVTVTIACERYVSSQSRRARTHQPTAQKVAGALEHMAERHKCGFVAQGPADAHAIASNEMLKRLGMLQTGATVDDADADDANMAIRHALLYLSHKHATVFQAILREHGVML